MSKRIIICCDGTANSALVKGAVPTNIQRISELLLPVGTDGKTQITYYHSGVGVPTTDIDSSGSYYDQAIGRSLDLHVKELYKFLVDNYVKGDEIYCFGFSRGAFTVRTLLGLIRHFGILDKSGYGEQINAAGKIEKYYYDATVINVIYELYRSNNHRDGAGLPREIGQSFFPVPIEFLGAFDTVAALSAGNEFHDIDLNNNIKMARHALAIDEQRIDYKPSMWQPLSKSDGSPGLRTVEGFSDLPHSQQMWFVGAHADVGGSYGGTEKEARGLANVALHWMLKEANKLGLTYNLPLLALYEPAPIEGEIHDELATEGDNAFGATPAPYIKPVSIEDTQKESYNSAKFYQLRGHVYRHVCSSFSPAHNYYPPESQGRWYGVPNIYTFGTAQQCKFTDTALAPEAKARLEDMAAPRNKKRPNYECNALFEPSLGESLQFASQKDAQKRFKPADPKLPGIFVPGLFSSTARAAATVDNSATGPNPLSNNNS